jgi:hypothetical protein
VSSTSEFLISQGIVLLGVILGFLANRRGIRNVHTLVNNQLDRQLDRNAQLTRTLTASGVDVPPTHTETQTGAT